MDVFFVTAVSHDRLVGKKTNKAKLSNRFNDIYDRETLFVAVDFILVMVCTFCLVSHRYMIQPK